MSSINVRKLIREVRKRPALYDRGCTEYGDKKDKLWREVYANVVERWIELSPELQELKGKQLQRRWIYLSEVYKKNLKKKPKFKRTEDKFTKPRRYGYINQLRFLGTSQMKGEKSPSRSKRDKTGSEDESDNIGKERTKSDDSKVSREQKLQNRQLRQKVTVNLQRNISIERQAKRFEKPQKTRPVIIPQEKLTKERCKQNVYMNMDEDECFLMSLLPAMRRFDGEHKFTAKIEIMSAVKKVMASQKTAAKPTARSQKGGSSNLVPIRKINSTSKTTRKSKTEKEIPSSTDLKCEKSGSDEANNSDLYDDVIYLDETMLDDSEIKSEEEE